MFEGRAREGAPFVFVGYEPIMERNKIVTADALMKVRLALYNAKHAIESQFDGEDRDAVIRSIIEALDVTRDLGDAP